MSVIDRTAMLVSEHRVELGGDDPLIDGTPHAMAAAMSPGGGRIATLTSSGDEEVSVTLLDMSSGARRQMWAGAGGWSEPAGRSSSTATRSSR